MICNVIGSNNIISATVLGIHIVSSTRTYFIANNTCIKNVSGFRQDHPSTASNTIFKNNLAQGNTGDDYIDDGAGWGTHAKNYSEDGGVGAPDGLTENFHDGTSNFVDYANDNYLIDSGGDAIDTLKAGEDLTGDFTDDIIGNTRLAATFFIGASWISLAAPSGRIMSSLVNHGGLAGMGGIAGEGGGLAG